MINRQNYEEFLVLYLDNELPLSMKEAVEQFIAGNPDLREEWDALLQCRIEPDDGTVFPDKNTLLRHEESLLPTSLRGHDESFLLYVDGELDPQNRKIVEELVQQHPGKAAELLRLQQTVSTPDLAVVFPDKELLYRSETQKRAVLLPWMRYSIAAAILVAVALLLLPRIIYETAPAIATAPKKIATPVTPSAPDALYSQRDTVKKEKTIVRFIPGETVHKPAPIAKTNPVEQPQRTAEIQYPTATQQATRSQPVAKLTITAVDTAGRSETPSARPETPAVAVIAPDKKAPIVPAVAVNIPREQSSFATQALLKEQQDQTSDMTVDDGTTPGKSKLRGLFRRVTRTFAKTADRDDEGHRQVLISAFQVDLK